MISASPPRGAPLSALGYVFDQQTWLLLRTTLITMGIGLVYWAVVILDAAG